MSAFFFVACIYCTIIEYTWNPLNLLVYPALYVVYTVVTINIISWLFYSKVEIAFGTLIGTKCEKQHENICIPRSLYCKSGCTVVQYLCKLLHNLFLCPYCVWQLLPKTFFIFFPHVIDSDGQRSKYSMIQYLFEGPEVDVKIKPHRNSKGDRPFFRTASLTRKHIK